MCQRQFSKLNDGSNKRLRKQDTGSSILGWCKYLMVAEKKKILYKLHRVAMPIFLNHLNKQTWDQMIIIRRIKSLFSSVVVQFGLFMSPLL